MEFDFIYIHARMIFCNKFLDFACDRISISVQPCSAAAPVRRCKYLTGPFDLTITNCQ